MTTYLVQKDTFRDAVRWRLSVLNNDDSTATLGYYPTRNGAHLAGRLLAGHSGNVVLLPS